MNDPTRSRRNSISDYFFPSFRLRSSCTDRHEELNEGCNRSKSWTSIIPSFLQKNCTPPTPKTSMSLPQDESVLEAKIPAKDTRQGPLETDLFWLVYRDLSESR